MRKDTKWDWNADCQRSFEQFKNMLQSNFLLTHYNPTLPIVVAADASKTGIGAVILHKFPNGSMKAIQHASRSLTQAEQAYGQPEKEALALVYAVTKFHKMLLGRKFTLQTDHKPLLSIFGSKKGIPVHTANRLQRWALILLNYDFDMQYVSTNEFGCADMLSRLINRSVRPEEDYVIAAVNLEEDMANILSTTIDAVPISFQALRDATRKCSILQQVIRYILEGWPNDPEQVAAGVKPFFNRRESLSIINDCVMFQERVIVPKVFQRRLLIQFHRGHPGMVRMKSIARSYVFWPGMDGEIEDFVRQCNHCAIAAKSPMKAVPEPWPRPDKPWSRIHIDYAGPVDGFYLLVVVDPFTRWPEVKLTKTTKATTTIKLLKQMFAMFGIPETIVSDNGTQFTSYHFKQFCESLGIRHIRTAPYHPQSNGLAERFVDTVKRSLKKIRSGGESLEEALETFLTVYRSTSASDLDGQSPSEKMMGRPMRTVSALLKPTVNIQQHSDKKDDPQLRSFKSGDTVHVQIHQANSWSWVPGVIIERIGKVNYNVLMDDTRRLIRSHINQLRSRVVPTVQCSIESPLTVFLDAFGLGRETNINEVNIPVAHAPEDPPVDNTDKQKFPPIPAEVPSLQSSEHQPLDDAEELPREDVPQQPDDEEHQPLDDAEELPREDVPQQPDDEEPEAPRRPRRLISLPSRFQGYWMF